MLFINYDELDYDDVIKLNKSIDDEFKKQIKKHNINKNDIVELILYKIKILNDDVDVVELLYELLIELIEINVENEINENYIISKYYHLINNSDKFELINRND